MKARTITKLKHHIPSSIIASSVLIATVVRRAEKNEDKDKARSITKINEVSVVTKSPTARASFPGLGQISKKASISDFNLQLLHQSLSIPRINVCQCESDQSSASYFEQFVRSFSKARRHQTMTLMSKSAIKNKPVTSLYTIHHDYILGEGAHGSVYLATKKMTNEKVALKVIPKKFTADESFGREMNTFLKIRNASSRGHPNICSLREHFDEDGNYFLILDLVAGGEMFDHLIRIGAYSEADAARLVQEVASALAFLHGIGVVHGDLKPENLMLSTDRPGDAVIKIVDFGSSYDEEYENKLRIDREMTKNASENKKKKKTKKHRPLTPAYCPPEIFKSSAKHGDQIRLHQSMDMWSLGVILYIMLTGLHPFDLSGNTPDKDIALKIIRNEKPPLRNSPITEHLSASAIDLIEKLIEWDPKNRLTAHEMLQHPWVRGETARTDIMADSDKKLSMFREFKTELEAKVFADMVNYTDDASLQTSLLERSFRNFDSKAKGFLTTEDLQPFKSRKSSKSSGTGESLSLSGFSNLLSENMKSKYFKSGDVVYKEGEIGNHMYFIDSGTIELTTKDGICAQRHRGDSFGEGALLHPKKIRSATVRCTTPVHAIQISREFFEKYLSDSNSQSQSNGYTLTLLNLKEKDRVRKRNRAKKILRLQKNLVEKDVTTNESLFRPGEDGELLYILEQGEIDIEVDGLRVFSLKPGDLCGEHSLLTNRPRNTLARCIHPSGCKVQVMQGKEFSMLLESSSENVRQSLRELCSRREFIKAVVKKTQRNFPSEKDENGEVNKVGLRKVFDTVDEEGKGKISQQNLEDLLKQFDPNMTEKEMNEVIESLHLNQNGSLTFEEFLRIFTEDGSQADSS